MKFFNIASKAINALIITCFLGVVALVCMQVFFRYILGHSLSWAEEMARFLFVWLIYTGGIIAVRRGMNITFDVLLESLPYKYWVGAFTLVNVICVGFLSIVVILGFNLASINMTQYSSSMRIPMGFAYLAIPVGSIGMIVSQIQWYLETIKKRRAEAC